MATAEPTPIQSIGTSNAEGRPTEDTGATQKPADANAQEGEPKRKGASRSRKIKLAFPEQDDCPITRLQEQLREREIKDVDIASVLKEALEQVPESWWKEKLDELTPLEWKVKMAMEDPKMREKITHVLAENEEEA